MTISVPYLIQLKSHGKIKYIGFSTYRLETVRMASKYKTFKELDVLLIYGHNTLINNSLTTIIPILTRHNIGLIDASPLALGLLRDSPPPDWHPTNSKQRQLVAKVAKMTKIGSNGKISLADLAVYHTLTNMLGTSLLIGMETVEQLNANIEVYRKVISIGNVGGVGGAGGAGDVGGVGGGDGVGGVIDGFEASLEVVKHQLREIRAIDIS